MSKMLILFPFGGNAKESLMSVFAINERTGEWEIAGFIDDDRSVHNKDCCGIKVLGGKEVLDKFPQAYVLAVPGSPSNYLKRKDIIQNLNLEKSRFATIAHPSVVIAPDASVGCNTLLMPNVVISCEVKIGDHCVILPNTVVSHDSQVGDYCCIGSNVTVSGSVKIGENCYIGSGTKIRENVSIGEGSLVGLGSNVISDIEPGVIAVGSPARVIRKIVS
jgi:sugar O-acyltransferase (sialic acid O-acetyltransferase NeuD family)